MACPRRKGLAPSGQDRSDALVFGIHRLLIVVIGLVAALACPLPGEDSAAMPAVVATPAFLRCVVPAQGAMDIAVTVHASRAGRVIACRSECPCVEVLDHGSLSFAPGADLRLHVRVAGVLPGMKTLMILTTAGQAIIDLQVVSAGLGQGDDQLRKVLALARRDQDEVWFILKDLKGALRNCGCSAGSLGGIDRLAALPAWCRSLDAALTLRWLRVGDSEGMRDGIGSALDAHGWAPAGLDIVLSSDPAGDLQRPGLMAVIPLQPTPLNHARLVRIPLGEGMVLAALLIKQGRIVSQMLIPVDRSLPADAAILSTLPHSPLAHVDTTLVTSTRCAACHDTAFSVWHASAHARAYADLAEADRTESCITCHSTAIPGTGLVAGVQCQSCHLDTQAHVASQGRRAVPGLQRCDACHDARHDPGFLADPAWAQILHGR